MGDAIYVVNRSTLVTDAEVVKMTNAVAAQLRDHVCPAWNLPAVWLFHMAPPKGAKVITIVDAADDPNALGYHDEIDTQQYGVVGCRPMLDQGYRVLTGPYSVSSVLSHEVLEMAVDGRCNLWADTGHGYLVALEVGDPVQADYYTINGVSVSNFTLPAWFDPQSKRTRVDHMSRLREPFTLRPGGYWIQMQGGQVTQRFGTLMPNWLIDAKLANPSSRTSRRERIAA